MLVSGIRSAITWLLVAFLALVIRQVGADEPELYGGIEIGSKGIKGVAIPIDNLGVPRLTDLRKLKTAVTNVTLIERDKDGMFRKEALDEARDAVHDYYKKLTGELHVHPDRIWIVASSGLTTKGRPSNFDELRKAVDQATENTVALREIDQKTEVELLILGAVPRENWRDAILLDVGSGNTKGGYYQPASGINLSRVVVMASEIEGSGLFTQTIQKEMNRRMLRNFSDFCDIAGELRKELVDKVRWSEVVRKPGLANRAKIFLSGGVIWAIATLSDPEAAMDDKPYMKLSLEHVRNFHDALKKTGQIPTPDVSRFSEPLRKQAQDQIDAVMNTFTPENLVAGSEILLGFEERLRWQKKEVYFTKSGVVAWIVGFVGRAEKK